MESIYYFISYCVGFVLSLVFYAWLNRQPVPNGDTDPYTIPFGLAAFMSFFWPIILVICVVSYPFEQLSKLWPTYVWQRFLDWYEGR